MVTQNSIDTLIRVLYRWISSLVLCWSRISRSFLISMFVSSRFGGSSASSVGPYGLSASGPAAFYSCFFWPPHFSSYSVMIERTCIFSSPFIVSYLRVWSSETSLNPLIFPVYISTALANSWIQLPRVILLYSLSDSSHLICLKT